jgi:hypothetical protein
MSGCLRKRHPVACEDNYWSSSGGRALGSFKQAKRLAGSFTEGAEVVKDSNPSKSNGWRLRLPNWVISLTVFWRLLRGGSLALDALDGEDEMTQLARPVAYDFAIMQSHNFDYMADFVRSLIRFASEHLQEAATLVKSLPTLQACLVKGGGEPTLDAILAILAGEKEASQRECQSLYQAAFDLDTKIREEGIDFGKEGLATTDSDAADDLEIAMLAGLIVAGVLRAAARAMLGFSRNIVALQAVAKSGAGPSTRKLEPSFRRARESTSYSFAIIVTALVQVTIDYELYMAASADDRPDIASDRLLSLLKQFRAQVAQDTEKP